MFEAVDGLLYFNAQWFYRSKDTVRKYWNLCMVLSYFKPSRYLFRLNLLYCSLFQAIEDSYHIDSKRVFYSEVTNYNELECLLGKVNIVRCSLDVCLIFHHSSFSFFTINDFIFIEEANQFFFVLRLTPMKSANWLRVALTIVTQNICCLILPLSISHLVIVSLSQSPPVST